MDRPKTKLSAVELEQRLRALLDDPALSDLALRESLEELSRHFAFSGLTWLYGPALYARNTVLFRPFLLAHFGSWEWRGGFRWRAIKWTGARGAVLDAWLEACRRADDLELFRRLYPWRLYSLYRGKAAARQWRLDLLAALAGVTGASAQVRVLARHDLWSALDEETAIALYQSAADVAADFILKHLPNTWYGGEKRALWTGLGALASERGDEKLRLALYRRQVPLKQWEQEVLGLCAEIRDPGSLCAALEERHPEGWGLDLGKPFFRLVEARQQDVFPYLKKHLRDVWSHWHRSGFDRMLKLAREQGWWDLWAGLVKVCARPNEYDAEVRALVEEHGLPDGELRRRLLMLTGVAREWNAPGFGLAQVKPLQDRTACLLYDRFPALLRGPFKVHVQASWGSAYPRLVASALAQRDELLIDFLASRYVTRAGHLGEGELVKEAEQLSHHYEALREDPALFSRRAAAVLSQVPACTIFDYGGLIRRNRLARLLFERSARDYLADPVALQDLVEGSEIHVQALAYRALSLDDDRARQGAADSLDILLGTLLRPLQRRTRALAFGALINAARVSERAAQRICSRAREALDLPDRRYPKAELIGLIGQLLDRWPSLRRDDERPVIYGGPS